MNWNKNHIVIFPNCVNRQWADEEVEIDIIGEEIVVHHNSQEMHINIHALRNGSSTSVCSGIQGDFVFYNMREILGIIGLKPQEFLRTFQFRSFCQIDKTSAGIFLKIFCLTGESLPKSQHTNWNKYEIADIKDLHQVDRKYSWEFQLIDQNITKDNRLVIAGSLRKSELWKQETLYFNYAGQTIALSEGNNQISCIYVPNENAYIGAKYSRYPGRCVQIGGTVVN